MFLKILWGKNALSTPYTKLVPLACTLAVLSARATADLVVSQRVLVEEESLDIPYFGQEIWQPTIDQFEVEAGPRVEVAKAAKFDQCSQQFGKSYRRVFLSMRHHIWSEGIHINFLYFFYPLARFEIFPLTENGDGSQEAKFGIVYLHFDHAATKTKQCLRSKTSLFIILFSKGMVVGKDDGLGLRIIPERCKRYIY